jgi:hypothetical protein
VTLGVDTGSVVETPDDGTAGVGVAFGGDTASATLTGIGGVLAGCTGGFSTATDAGLDTAAAGEIDLESLSTRRGVPPCCVSAFAVGGAAFGGGCVGTDGRSLAATDSGLVCTGTTLPTGACAAAGTVAGGVAITCSCGVAPATFTCSCSVLPGNRFICGSVAVTTWSPILSAVRPSAVLPTTSACNTCPTFSTSASVSATRAAATAWDGFGTIGLAIDIAEPCRIRVNGH